MDHLRWPLLVVILACLIGGPARGAEPLPLELAELRTPTPLEDDAQLHDVRFVGENAGWAVGEHGVIWHTADGGTTWELQHSGVDCALHGICFLSDRVGWIVGGGSAPFTHLSYGVLLSTTDGGKTWKLLSGLRTIKKPPVSGDKIVTADAADPQPAEKPSRKTAKSKGESPVKNSNEGKRVEISLPRLHGVKFFSLDQGIVIGQATDTHPTGMLRTEDGGRTWEDVAGKPSDGWRAADFVNPEEGAVAGLRGSVGLLVGNQLGSPRMTNLGNRGLYDIALQRGGQGSLVGDGGLVLWTENGGLVWQASPTALPDEVREIFDFRTVARRGDKVWIAGQPGSVIWHSPDAGQTWKKQLTGQTLPLSSVMFSSDQNGWAVGALGTILRTQDAGQTWEILRGAGRRLAIMSLYANSEQVSLNLVTQLSREGGYRSLVELLPRQDLGPDAKASLDLDARLNEAVSLSGGSAAAIGWQFPLDIPGLGRDQDKLIADWNRRTEGRLGDVLSGHLVRQIRAWRPSIIILDQPTEKDAVTQLLNQAVQRAVDFAADATRLVEQHELASLDPWRVERVFLRLPPGSAGHASIDPHQFLPRAGQSVQMSAAAGLARLTERTDLKPLRETYRLLEVAKLPDAAAQATGDFFNGLHLSPGSDARRALPVFDDSDLEAKQQIVRRQRNFSGYVDRYLKEPRHAGQILGQWNELTRGMPDDQAALQAAQLAESYASTGQWELAELTLMELVQSYPDQPVAIQAMQSLVQNWGSAEVTWRRVRKSAIEEQKLKSDPGDIRQKLEQAAATLDAQEEQINAENIPTNFDDSMRAAAAPAAEIRGDSKVARHQLDAKFAFWQDMAVRLARRIEQRSPALFAEPQIQFPLASIYRQRSVFKKSDEIYRTYAQGGAIPGWSRVAGGEMWLASPQQQPTMTVAVCEPTSRRPILDGVLSDKCWEDADELPLVASADRAPERGTQQALAMICYDKEYLYLAASLPRLPGAPTDMPQKGARRHDDDLADFDRISLVLDVDRDYATYYSFTVDQRGCLAEQCGVDSSWNPKWFVAVDADNSHWRVELAIPLSELGPRPPGKNMAWNVGIIRTIPAVGLQSWTHPASSVPRPETFGLVRFD